MINKETFYTGLRETCHRVGAPTHEAKLNKREPIDKILKENTFESFYMVEELFSSLRNMRVGHLILEKQEKESSECPECGRYTEGSDSDDDDSIDRVWFELYFSPDYNNNIDPAIYLGGMSLNWNTTWSQLYRIWKEYEEYGENALIKFKKYGNN